MKYMDSKNFYRGRMAVLLLLLLTVAAVPPSKQLKATRISLVANPSTITFRHGQLSEPLMSKLRFAILDANGVPILLGNTSGFDTFVASGPGLVTAPVMLTGSDDGFFEALYWTTSKGNAVVGVRYGGTAVQGREILIKTVNIRVVALSARGVHIPPPRKHVRYSRRR